MAIMKNTKQFFCGSDPRLRDWINNLEHVTPSEEAEWILELGRKICSGD